jgi:hypothetical protein
MSEVSDKKTITVRIAGKTDELDDDPWKNTSPSERIEAVWTLTKLCLAWNKNDSDEPITEICYAP